MTRVTVPHQDVEDEGILHVIAVADITVRVLYQIVTIARAHGVILAEEATETKTT